jgi:CHAT domain-containing protein/tetratricopeptide (TPR) repeat protein
MFGHRGRTIALLVLFLSALLTIAPGRPAAQTAEPATRLDAGGAAIERTLTGSQQHRYELHLQAGEYARVSLTQQGIDVIAKVEAPDGAVLNDFNSELRPGRDEGVDVVSDAAGTYTLTVRAAFPHAADGAYAIRIVETRQATADDRSLGDLWKLHAEYAPALERYQTAAVQPLVERALAMAERTRGPNDPIAAIVRRDLGRVFHRDRQFAKALPLFERAAATFEQVLGPEHPRTLDAWTSLSATYGALGQRPKAEQLAQRALDVGEKVLGPDHPQLTLILITLANRRQDAEDLDAAEAFVRRGLRIAEKTLGEMHIQTGILLNNLASLLITKGNFDEAATLLGRSLVIDQTLRPDDAPDLAITLQNLGVVARQRKDYAAAEDYYLRALALRRRTLGPDHPEIALNLNNLANVYRLQRDIPKALDTHFQALHILERTAGPYSGGTILSLGNIARTYAEIGDVAHAIEFQRRVDTAIETQVALNLAIGSERQKLVFASSMADRTDRTISLDVDTRFTHPDATGLATLVVLQRKGRVLDVMTDAFASVRQRLASAADRELLDQLRNTTGELARLALGNAGNASSGDRVTAIERLETRKEQLESALSDRSAEFRAQVSPVTLDAVQALIPDDAALIEFAVYRPFDPKAESNATAYGVPRYVAYVVLPHQPPRGFDLGPAAAIDDGVEQLRHALRDPNRQDVTVLSRRLDALVLQPVRAVMGNSTRLLISPDGALNLVPFEALRDEQNRYAVERYAISYLSSGRDLLRLQVRRTSHSAAVVVADPAFGGPDAGVSGAEDTPAGKARRSVTSVDDLSDAYFARLEGTGQEAQRIKALFPEATVLARERATKSALVALDAPRVLHIATHGFFLRDSAHRIPNPLLRSGLALAGANTGSRITGNQTTDAGILTALEASTLNLWGTRLVTLSACDTGVGEVRNGEGVYGLRRAFLLAGAETLVMSLWPVRDSVTREMMTAYYTGLRQGLGRGDALRQAQRAMLARTARRHPFYWASFIQAGDWAPLDDGRPPVP